MTSILELHTIFREPGLLDELHRAQRRRVSERIVFGEDRPGGMRLSIDDPVRRVKAALDERWRVAFNPGIGERGYLAEDLLEVALFHTHQSAWYGAAYETQVPVPWGGEHESAFDFVIRGERVVSCKSSVTTPIEKQQPSSANVRQEQRMLVAYGCDAGAEWDTYMVHPGSLAARGPFVNTLIEQDVERVCNELEATIAAYKHFKRFEKPFEVEGWNDPAYWRSEYGLESTSGAFVFDRLDASAAVEARNRAFLRAREQLRAAKAEEEAAKAVIREHVEEQLRLNPDAASVMAYGGDRVAVYSVDKRGALRVTEKPHDDAGALV